MQIISSIVILLLHLVVESRQAPTGGELQNGKASPPSTPSLYALVDNYTAYGAGKKRKLQYKKDFAGHPDIAKVDLDNEDRQQTINQLLEIKQQNARQAVSKNWAQKFTLATYQLVKDRNPKLLKDFQLYNHGLVKKNNNARKNERYRSVEDGKAMKQRQRGYEAKMREKRRRQREEGSVMDQPLLNHMGEVKKGADRPTAAQVVEQTKQYQHLYSNPSAFRFAIRDYLRDGQYMEEDITSTLQVRGRVSHLKSMRERNAKRRKEQREAKASHGVDRPDSVEAARYELLAKKARISQHLASTDWYKTHHL
jgi:hypothetical protein